MQAHFEFIGIALQFTTGILFLLKEALPDPTRQRISARIYHQLEQLGTHTRRKWQIGVIMTLLAVAALLVLGLIYLGLASLDIKTITGILFFILLGSLAYLTSFTETLKFMRRWQRVKLTESQTRFRQQLYSNSFLFILSACILILFLISSNFFILCKSTSVGILSMCNALIFLWSIFAFIITLPVLISSMTFLFFLGFVEFFKRLGRISPTIFWILLVVLWASGGTFLLIYAWPQ